MLWGQGPHLKEMGTIYIKKPGHSFFSSNGIEMTDYRKENEISGA
jgi:hypothetical protein